MASRFDPRVFSVRRKMTWTTSTRCTSARMISRLRATSCALTLGLVQAHEAGSLLAAGEDVRRTAAGKAALPPGSGQNVSRSPN
jgi:hypothetical protein